MNAPDRLGRLGWLVCATACIVATGPVRGDTTWTGVLTQQALTSGYQARLPPNLSLQLGLSAKGESVPVRQLLSRKGKTVRAFNVSVANPRDVVIFLVDESAQSTVAYLITPGGKLRKAVLYRSGGEAAQLATSEARPGLAREVRYWSDQAAGSKAQPAAPVGPTTAPPAPTAAPPAPNPEPKAPGGPTTP